MQILEFLNNQPGETLFWYGVFTLIALGIIGDTISKSIKHITKPKPKCKCDDKLEDEN